MDAADKQPEDFDLELRVKWRRGRNFVPWMVVVGLILSGTSRFWDVLEKLIGVSVG